MAASSVMDRDETNKISKDIDKENREADGKPASQEGTAGSSDPEKIVNERIIEKETEKHRRLSGKERAEQEPGTVDTEFMKEKIKQRPVNRRKILKTTLTTAGLAVLFGTVACLVFIFLEPVFSKAVTTENSSQEVTFDEQIDQMQTEEIPPESMIENDSELASSAASKAANEAASKAAQEAAEAAVSGSSTQIEQAVSKEVEDALDNYEITSSDYQKIYSMLDGIAQTASRSMVVVTGVTSDYTWFNEAYEDADRSSGLIVADNGTELLIFTQYDDLKNADSIKVTFPDGSGADAELKAMDAVSGYAVVAVRDSDITDSVRTCFDVAELGSSKQSNLTGVPVIALGSPMGTAGSVAYGIVTSTTQSPDIVDSSCKLITTDSYGSRNATGALFNLNGQVIGILNMDYNSSDLPNMISAIGITDLKPLIEKLSNGGSKPYLGIYGADVPANITSDQGVPQGAYVRRVEVDSPAMDAGIQSGDVITGFDGEEIGSYSDLLTALFGKNPGEEVKIRVQRSASGGEYEEMTLTAALSEEPDS